MLRLPSRLAEGGAGRFKSAIDTVRVFSHNAYPCRYLVVKIEQGMENGQGLVQVRRGGNQPRVAAALFG
jgi:hypothetical protein